MRSEYDAAFIHGQGYRNFPNPNRKPVPAERGRLEMSAIRKLLKANTDIGIFMFSGKTFTGQTLPLAQVDAEALQRRTGIDSSRIIADNTASTTTEEVGFSKNKFDKHHWRNVLHITADNHTREVRRDIKRKFGKKNQGAEVISAENILLTSITELFPDTPFTLNQIQQDRRNIRRYDKYISKYHESQTEANIRRYEQIKYFVKSIPFGIGDRLLETIAHFYRPDPAR